MAPRLLKEIEASCQELARDLGISITFHQSNLEGELVNLIQSAHGNADAIIMNPAGLFVYVNCTDRRLENIRRTENRGSYLEYSRQRRIAPALDHLERFYRRHLRSRPLRIHRRYFVCRAKAREAAGYGAGVVERPRGEQQSIDEIRPGEITVREGSYFGAPAVSLSSSCPGLSRASTSSGCARKTWMAGTSPAMTRRGSAAI